MTSLKMFFCLLLTVVCVSRVHASSGIGGSGGGPRAVHASFDGTVKVEICDSSQKRCKLVTYRVQANAKPEAVKCVVPWGEGGIDVPCPKNYGVPAWLSGLMSAYQSDPKKKAPKMASEVPDTHDYVGGP